MKKIIALTCLLSAFVLNAKAETKVLLAVGDVKSQTLLIEEGQVAHCLTLIDSYNQQIGSLEIEIEGKDGWCKNLPTAKNVFFNFTFYHILMICIIALTFYKIFNKKDIWMIIFYITMFFYIEDYLWFIYNPFYTYKKYSKEFIPRHKHWFLGQPIENYICYFIIMYFISYYF